LQGEQCDVVFAPEANAMYHGDTRAFVDVEGVSLRWEAEARPGHFRGVATVVAKLFNLVRAHHAYFGEKDLQQLKVIEAMARGLNFEVEIVPCPTVREDDGLALSSRNAYLTPEQRAAAPVIYRALKTARAKARNGYYDVKDLTAAIHGVLQSEPILEAEYAAIVDDETLEPLERLTDITSARAIIAVRAGNTRLIDNLALNK
jgi:pantoate--beta-alanine ligase